MSKPSLPVLTGKSVTLRPPKSGDAVARYRLGRNLEIFRMYGGSRSDFSPMTMVGAERWLQGIADHDHAWIIETDRLIGHIRLDRVDLSDRRATLAMGIDDPESLGKGFGSEAIVLVQAYAFNMLNLHRLSLRVVAYNLRAIRAYEKCGFVMEGREREAAFVDGEWHDDVMMGMLAQEYLVLHPRLS